MFDPLALDLDTWAHTPFPSSQHMIQAMSHPQYRINPAFREAIEAKLALDEGNIGVSVSTDSGTLQAGASEHSEATRLINSSHNTSQDA